MLHSLLHHLQWRTVELMSRKLVEVAELLEIYVVDTAYPDSKGIGSLNRGEHGSTSFTDGGNGTRKLLLRSGIDRRRHVRGAACRRGIGGGGSRIEWLFFAAADECVVRDKCDIAVCFGLRGSGSRSHGSLHHPSLDSLRVSFIQTAVECAACLVSDGDHAWIDVIGQHGAVVEGQPVVCESRKEHEIFYGSASP